MFLVNSFLEGWKRRRGRRGPGRGPTECARRPAQRAGGGGGGKREGSGGGGGGRRGGTSVRILGGVISAISDAAAQYNPEPPPPRTHYSNIEANESEKARQFRRLFAQLAGEDMEVSATELVNILNKVVTRHPDLKTDGIGIVTCRSTVAVMDSDTTGKLGFEEFTYLWNIKKC
ncbi:hypothetical protein EI555_005672 [Monodon monoceros]|uniref:Uncharacterized protein n=1 Tax=Monodon monoceros TaxID=40151 RepID=A0A4U1FTW7_MONMO|nr:hypothetical protein EI555_005672 [Monodon monoceros]